MINLEADFSRGYIYKEVKKGEKEGEVLLVPENLAEYDPKPISVDLIREIFQVLGCLKKVI